MKRELKIILGLALLIMIVSACAPSGYTNVEHGFFKGIWHGICLPFTLIGKLFGADIGIYADHNSGFTYWLGFILGLSALGGGGAASRR